MRRDEDCGPGVALPQLDRDLAEPVDDGLEPTVAQVVGDRRGEAVLVPGRRRNARERTAAAEQVGAWIAERDADAAVHGFVRQGHATA